MLVDARTIPDNQALETEICIIGGGAAGITLARKFIGQPFRVSLLESGGFEFEQETQSLYEGKSVGLPYFPLHVPRLRYFGGATNHWGGLCRPLDDLDFERQEWIPYSGWPVRKADLEPYYEEARTICQLKVAEWDLAFWQERDRYAPFSFEGDRVITRVAQQAPSSLRRFGQTYRDEVVAAENVTTYLYANVTDIEADETAQNVTRLHVACLAGNKFSITARLFVLAVGGIENPRLLLLSNKKQPAGLGNQHDLVGRFFLEHPRFTAGTFLPSSSRGISGFYLTHHNSQANIKGYLSLSEEARRSEKLADVQIRLEPVYNEAYVEALQSQEVASFRYLLRAFKRQEHVKQFSQHLRNVLTDIMSWQNVVVPGAPVPLPDPLALAGIIEEELALGVAPEAEPLLSGFLGDIALFGVGELFKNVPVEYYHLSTRIDPVPDPDSRITLTTERDQLGQNRAQLDWRLNPLDKHSARRTLEVLAAELGQAGLGRLQIDLDDDDTTWPEDLAGGSHHMGTTRMSDDPKQGVVDKNCQVYGLSNLFIAGSSVFPTGGSGTPTLTLVALTLRLAEHIKERMND